MLHPGVLLQSVQVLGMLFCSLERLFHLAGLILSEHFAFYLKGEVGNSGKR